MTKKALSGPTIWVENIANLAAVTEATNGASVETKWYKYKTVFVNITVNTGAVTVSIQASHDGTTWFTLDSKVHTAVETDVYSYNSHFPFMRTITATQSSSTVTTTITGGN